VEKESAIQGTFVKEVKKYNVHLEDMAKVMAKLRIVAQGIAQLDFIVHGTLRIQLNAQLGRIVHMATFNVFNVSKKVIIKLKAKRVVIIESVVIHNLK